MLLEDKITLSISAVLDCRLTRNILALSEGLIEITTTCIRHFWLVLRAHDLRECQPQVQFERSETELESRLEPYVCISRLPDIADHENEAQPKLRCAHP